ncbi:hypothetical protein B0H16DRAFT_1458674 [Mycena metata]|uniref:Uncharacterized protein n=1 Tax=Mycena metata TaxID=1033252 RepID=A0AAD7NCL3_9AGAR|nr:hypothetical protein B0H16DRAFT_1458674 [Mycena metata]
MDGNILLFRVGRVLGGPLLFLAASRCDSSASLSAGGPGFAVNDEDPESVHVFALKPLSMLNPMRNFVPVIKGLFRLPTRRRRYSSTTHCLQVASSVSAVWTLFVKIRALLPAYASDSDLQSFNADERKSVTACLGAWMASTLSPLRLPSASAGRIFMGSTYEGRVFPVSSTLSSLGAQRAEGGHTRWPNIFVPALRVRREPLAFMRRRYYCTRRWRMPQGNSVRGNPIGASCTAQLLLGAPPPHVQNDLLAQKAVAGRDGLTLLDAEDLPRTKCETREPFTEHSASPTALLLPAVEEPELDTNASVQRDISRRRRQVSASARALDDVRILAALAVLELPCRPLQTRLILGGVEIGRLTYMRARGSRKGRYASRGGGGRCASLSVDGGEGGKRKEGRKACSLQTGRAKPKETPSKDPRPSPTRRGTEHMNPVASVTTKPDSPEARGEAGGARKLGGRRSEIRRDETRWESRPSRGCRSAT